MSKPADPKRKFSAADYRRIIFWSKDGRGYHRLVFKPPGEMSTGYSFAWIKTVIKEGNVPSKFESKIDLTTWVLDTDSYALLLPEWNDGFDFDYLYGYLPAKWIIGRLLAYEKVADDIDEYHRGLNEWSDEEETRTELGLSE